MCDIGCAGHNPPTAIKHFFFSLLQYSGNCALKYSLHQNSVFLLPWGIQGTKVTWNESNYPHGQAGHHALILEKEVRSFLPPAAPRSPAQPQLPALLLSAHESLSLYGRVAICCNKFFFPPVDTRKNELRTCNLGGKKVQERKKKWTRYFFCTSASAIDRSITTIQSRRCCSRFKRCPVCASFLSAYIACFHSNDSTAPTLATSR